MISSWKKLSTEISLKAKGRTDTELQSLFAIGPRSSFFQDISATTPATTVGQAVARVNKAGKIQTNWLQSDAARMPLLQSNNGLLFDGSNDNISLVLSDEFATISHLWVFTINLTDMAANHTLFNMGPNSGNGRLTFSVLSNGRIRIQLVNASNVSAVLTDTIPVPLVTSGVNTTIAIQIKDEVFDISINGMVVREDFACNTSTRTPYTHAEIGALRANGTTTVSAPMKGRLIAAEIFRV